MVSHHRYGGCCTGNGNVNWPTKYLSLQSGFNPVVDLGNTNQETLTDCGQRWLTISLYLRSIGKIMKTLKEQETQAFLDLFEAMKAMEIKLAITEQQLNSARERVAQLESRVYGTPSDNWS